MAARTPTTVLFDGSEPLDVFGPLELFGNLPDQFRLVLGGPGDGPVRSAHGTPVVTDFSYETLPPPDIVLVPGGRGARPLATDAGFLRWLARWAAWVRADPAGGPQRGSRPQERFGSPPRIGIRSEPLLPSSAREQPSGRMEGSAQGGVTRCRLG